MLCGSAFKNKGVQAMLDAVIDYMPAPTDIPPVKGELENGKEGERKPSDDEPFSALAFKIMTDPFVGQLVFFRVYSGVINSGDTVYNPIKGRKERIGRILQMHANQREDIKEVRAGDIAAAVGLKEATTGDTLSDPAEGDHAREDGVPGAGDPRRRRAEDQGRPGEDGHRAQSPGAGRPVVSRAHRRGVGADDHLRDGRAPPRDPGRPHEARVRRRSQRRRAAGRVSRGDQEAGRRSKASSSSSRAAAASTATSGSRWSRASTGKGFEFVDAIKGGTVPREYIPGGREGPARDAAERRARRLSRSWTSRSRCSTASRTTSTSNENAFKMAASMAFKDGMRQASPMLLEPMMAVEVETPEDFMGNVVGDLSSRRGMIQGMDDMPDRQGHQGGSAAGRDVRLFDDAALAVAGARDVHDGIQALHRGAEVGRRGRDQQES